MMLSGYTVKDIIMALITHAPAILASIAAIVAASRAKDAVKAAQESKRVSLNNNTKLSNVLQATNGKDINTIRAAQIKAGDVPGDRAEDIVKVDNKGV